MQLFHKITNLVILISPNYFWPISFSINKFIENSKFILTSCITQLQNVDN